MHLLSKQRKSVVWSLVVAILFPQAELEHHTVRVPYS